MKYGDILYTEGGDRDKLGRGTVWKEEVKDCIHQNHIFRARPISSDYDPNYISYYSRTKEAKDYFFKHGKQTTNLASINISILSNLPVPVIPIEEQLRLVEKLDSNFSIYNNAKEFIEQILKDVLRLKYRVLRKAFSGKLVEPYSDEAGTVRELLMNMDIEKAENEESQKKHRQNQPKRKKMNEQFKEIIDILQDSKAPISAKEVWERSLYRDDIEKFYSELKKIHTLVIEKEKGMLSITHKKKSKI